MPSARVLCAFIVLLMAALPAHGREFRASDIYPADYPTVKAITEMDRLLRERSGGRDGITLLAHVDREAEAEMVAHVRDGSLDIARVNISALNATLPATVAPSLPFLFKSQAQARRILDGPLGEEILATLEPQGMIGLCFYDAGPRSFYSTKRAIRTPADLKGMKVRVQQSDVWTGLMRALGVEAVPIPFDGVYAYLQSGAIDAADNNWPSYVASRHYTLAKYFSRTEHSMAPAVLIFSKKVWDGLTREDQALIRGAAKESVAPMRKLWDEYDTSAPRTVQAAGGEIVTDVDKKAFADALLPLYPTVITDPGLRGLVQRIQNED
jgi:tripartite ATP-independent transporter DctP family solute receptor